MSRSELVAHENLPRIQAVVLVVMQDRKLLGVCQDPGPGIHTLLPPSDVRERLSAQKREEKQHGYDCEDAYGENVLPYRETEDAPFSLSRPGEGESTPSGGW